LKKSISVILKFYNYLLNTYPLFYENKILFIMKNKLKFDNKYTINVSEIKTGRKTAKIKKYVIIDIFKLDIFSYSDRFT